MKTYERAFGIDWNDAEDGDSANEKESKASVSQRQTRPPSLQRGNSRDIVSQPVQPESERVTRVRNRCRTQNDALASWWKVALQSYVQQRMWMQLGRNKQESILPPRYERLYQPEKIAQFDRFFARGWAAPVRRSHTAQHSEGTERDAEATELRRVISDRPRSESDGARVEPTPKKHTLKELVDKNGFVPSFDSSLKTLAALHDVGSASSVHSLDYLGRLDTSETKERDEYSRYVSPSSSLFDAPHSYESDKVAEFTACLHDYSLKADNVAGIRKVSMILKSCGIKM